MIRRLAPIAVVLAFLAVPGIAAAQQYPPTATALTVANSTSGPGSAVSIEGGGFVANTDVVITDESAPATLVTVKASAAGTIATSVKIRADGKPGYHSFKAAGAGASGGVQVLSAGVNVGGVGSPPGVSGTLARTGASNGTIPTALVAAGLALVGGVLVFSVRRRRAPDA